MADRIIVNDSELESCIMAYKQSLETLNEAVTTYQGALEALRNDWTGRAFAIMSAKVVEMVAKIVGSFDRVNDAINELGQVKELFGENESDLATQFNNLDAGTKSPFAG